MPFSLEWIGGPHLCPSLYVAALAGVLFQLWRHRRALAVAILTLALFPLLYYLSPYTYVNVEPRYLTILSPIIALVVGSMMTTQRRGLIVLTCALALSLTGLVIMKTGDLAAASDTAEGVVVPADFNPLIHLLESRGVTHVYTGYWVAWRLTYLTGERVIAVTAEGNPVIRNGRVDPNDTDFGRYPPFYRQAHADRNAAHVFILGGLFEKRFKALLLRAGYRRIVTGGFAVYLPPLTP